MSLLRRKNWCRVLRTAAEPLRDLHDSVLSGDTTRVAKKPVMRGVGNTNSVLSGIVVDNRYRSRTNRSLDGNSARKINIPLFGTCKPVVKCFAQAV